MQATPIMPEPSPKLDVSISMEDVELDDPQEKLKGPTRMSRLASLVGVLLLNYAAAIATIRFNERLVNGEQGPFRANPSTLLALNYMFTISMVVRD